MSGPSATRDDRVLGFTRGLSLFIAPFLVVAFVILYLLPGRTDHLWAWTIPVRMTSMVLASAYLGGAYFFLRVLREHRWSAMRAGFPPVAFFSGLLGVATVVHWDKFAHGNPAFWIWATLYFTAPPLVVVAFVRNQRYAGSPASGEPVLGPVVRGTVALFGVGALVTGLVMFVRPTTMIGQWPWALTPLTCRVMGAVFCLAAAGLAAWFDPRWETVRLMSEVTVVMLVLILVAAVRARAELDAGRALTWPLALGVGVLLLGSLALQWRHRRTAPL
jgi:hypothetical protein